MGELGREKTTVGATGRHSERRCRATVLGLLLACGPAAVFFAVVPVVVDAFDGVSYGRSLTHVTQEGFKVRPLVTNCDASAAIVFESCATLRQASVAHGLPRAICQCDLPFECMPVRCDTFQLETPAASMLAALEIASMSDALVPAVAEASPSHLDRSRVIFSHKSPVLTQNDEAYKSFSGEINQFWHGHLHEHYTRLGLVWPGGLTIV